jgi:outer membrane protein OmpA-like peptidoglycan-associated protein
MELAGDYVRTLLAIHPSTVNGVRKSQLQWIEDMVNRVASSAVPRELPHLSALTGIVPQAGRDSGAAALPIFRYDLALSLKYKGTSPETLKALRVGGYYGELSVVPGAAPSWGNQPRTYKVFLVGGGVVAGKGTNADLKAQATMITNEEWTPADFPGSLKLFEGGVWAGKKILGKRIGVGVRDASLVIHGSGTHKEAILALDELKEERTDYGAEFNANWGRIFDLDHVFVEEDFTRRRSRIDYAVRKIAKDETYFDFGCAPLTNTGRTHLRQFAAAWLPWLESAESNLKIVGHADTVDTLEFNKMLSELRAINVRQALRDILGAHLAIPDAHIEWEGQGKEEALRMGLPDKTKIFGARRVDVYLNGRLVVAVWRS